MRTLWMLAMPAKDGVAPRRVARLVSGVAGGMLVGMAASLVGREWRHIRRHESHLPAMSSYDG